MIEATFTGAAGGTLLNAKRAKVSALRNSRIITLDAMLDIGSIQEDMDSDYRRNLPMDIIMSELDEKECQDHSGDGAEARETEVKKAVRVRITPWQQLIAAAKAGEPVRMWYGEAPDELCGLYHACSALIAYPGLDVSVVKAPDRVKTRGKWFTGNFWAIEGTETLKEALKREDKLSIDEMSMYAELWENLVRENAPLRTVIGGQIVSVDEDFYDGIILRVLGDRSIMEQRLLADLCALSLGVSYSWYIIRVHRLIDSGKIVIAKNANTNKRRVLRKKTII